MCVCVCVFVYVCPFLRRGQNLSLSLSPLPSLSLLHTLPSKGSILSMVFEYVHGCQILAMDTIDARTQVHTLALSGTWYMHQWYIHGMVY